MKFNINDFEAEVKHLDNTCSIGVTYNRPPKTSLDEFKSVMDIVFSKRLTELRINFSFQKEELMQYLLEKLTDNQTLSEIYINYIKKDYTADILQALKQISSLGYVELQTKINDESSYNDIVDLSSSFLKSRNESVTNNRVIVKYPSFPPGEPKVEGKKFVALSSIKINPEYPRPNIY